MKKLLLLVFTATILFSAESLAQHPGKSFGFGIIVGEPTGATLKFWTNRQNAFVIDVGASYFGSPRIGVDYLWHFNAFESDIVGLYAGPGGVIGFGEGKGFWYKKKGEFYFREGSEVGIGMRGVFGLNVIPRDAPLEFFLELGVLVGLAPDFGSAVDAALGMRFYP